MALNDKTKIETWYTFVGNLVLNFAILDGEVLNYLRLHLSDIDFARVSKLQFADRLKRFEERFLEEDQGGERFSELNTFLERIAPIREIRNHVAHGHFFVRWRGLKRGRVLHFALCTEGMRLKAW